MDIPQESLDCTADLSIHGAASFICNLDLLPHLVFPIPLTNVRHTPDRCNDKVNTREATNTVQPDAIPDQLRYPRVVQDITYDACTGGETNQGTPPEQRYG
jgi:hypothetical protein